MTSALVTRYLDRSFASNETREEEKITCTSMKSNVMNDVVDESET